MLKIISNQFKPFIFTKFEPKFNFNCLKRYHDSALGSIFDPTIISRPHEWIFPENQFNPWNRFRDFATLSDLRRQFK